MKPNEPLGDEEKPDGILAIRLGLAELCSEEAVDELIAEAERRGSNDRDGNGKGL
jgi:hypothetical protein